MSEKTHTLIQKPDTAQVQGPLHPLVAKVLEKDPSPETLDKLLALQREWQADNAKRAFTEALVALKRDMPAVIGKNKKADMGQGKPRYSYATLAKVMDDVTPHLVNHGFSTSAPATTTTDPKTGATVITVKATLTHHAGHCEYTTLSGPVDTTGSKSALQAIGSSITYLQRYATLSLLGIATDDMAEPTGNPAKSGTADEKIDVPKNMAALNHFIGLNKTKAEVEAFVGKAVQDWTEADRTKLREWDASRKPKVVEAETVRETKAEPEPEGDNLVSLSAYRGQVKTVSVQRGNDGKNGKPKTNDRFCITAESGEQFFTFHKSHGELAKEVKTDKGEGSGEEVVIRYEPGPHGNSIKAKTDMLRAAEFDEAASTENEMS